MEKWTCMRRSHLLALIATGIILFLGLLYCFPNEYPNLFNVCLYLFVSISFPLLFVLFCWHKKAFKVLSIILAVALILAAFSLYCVRTVFTETSFEKYLDTHSKFNEVAASYLPPYEVLCNNSNVQYLHKWKVTGEEYLFLRVAFSEGEYHHKVSQLEELFAACISSPGAPLWYEDGKEFQLESVTYKSLTFCSENRNYAFAYAADDTSHRITYLFFCCEEISYMSSAGEAFRYCGLDLAR